MRRVRPPAPLAIDAGLATIPRQIATFAQFRHAMLAAPARPPLAHWRARGDQDLGVMLIEMWAYVCDVVAFYDETIAHESYLRTARRARPCASSSACSATDRARPSRRGCALR